MMNAMLSDATPVYLLSPWKPFLMTAAFIAWAWFVSTYLESDARAAHLNHVMWNGIHTVAAFVALFIMLFGVNFYIAFPIGIAVMIGPTLLYMKARNAAVSEEHKFHLGADTIKSAMDQRKKARTVRQVSMKFSGKDGILPVPEKGNPLRDVYITAEEMISEAIRNRASHLELQLTSKRCQGMYVVDGISTNQEPLSADLGMKIFAFLKEAAGTDSADVRRRQTGEFDVAEDSGDTHVDLTVSGSSSTHMLRLEFDRSERIVRPWDSIGLLPRQRELLDQLKQDSRRHGIVLVGGPTQSGTTTTGYSILSQHDAYLCNIVTLENEIFATLEGITHQAVGSHEGDYSTQLQTLIRRDPEVILAADMNDAVAAKIAAKPGKEGPLIFITMRANSMSDLVSKWAGFVADPRQSFGALQAVVFQRLVRRLCENCRVPYKPSPDLAKQGLPIDTVEQLYRKGGQVEKKNKVITCPVCNGTGYLGQVGVFETMFLDTNTRKHLIAGDLKAAKTHARRNKCMIKLQEAGWQKVAEGVTSLEEFGRVSSKKKSSKKATASS